MPIVDTLNFAQDIISTSDISATSSSLSSSTTEKSALSEGSHYSFSSVSTDNYFSQELSASLQNLINQGEQRENIEYWAYEPSINSHENSIGNNEFPYFLTQPLSNRPPPPPLEFDVSPSDDQILSTEELDAIFDSFSAAADGHNDYRIVYRDNKNHIIDLLEDERLTQALESFSII